MGRGGGGAQHFCLKEHNQGKTMLVIVCDELGREQR